MIDGARLFARSATAIADLNFVFATTARERDGFKPVRGPVEAARIAAGARAGRPARPASCSGASASASTMRRSRRADEIVTFPVDPGFASLNIAQAVLLMAYEWMKSGLETETDTAFAGPAIAPAAKEQLAGLFGHLEEALAGARLFPPAVEKAQDGRQSARRADAAGLRGSEIKVLRGVLASLDYFSPNEPRGAGYPERKAAADRKADSARRRRK